MRRRLGNKADEGLVKRKKSHERRAWIEELYSCILFVFGRDLSDLERRGGRPNEKEQLSASKAQIFLKNE